MSIILFIVYFIVYLHYIETETEIKTFRVMIDIIYIDYTLSNYYHTDYFTVPTRLVFYYKVHNRYKYFKFDYIFKNRYWESGIKRKPWDNIHKLTITNISDGCFETIGDENFLYKTYETSPFYDNVICDIRKHIRIEKLKDLDI
jgi:hypothetical protein